MSHKAIAPDSWQLRNEPVTGLIANSVIHVAARSFVKSWITDLESML